MCFTHESSASKEGNPAGIMNFGGTNPELLHSTPMVFAEQKNNEGWYTVRIQAIYLRTNGGLSVEEGKGDALLPDAEYDLATNGPDMAEYTKIDSTPAAINNGEVIVDSGTTDTYLNAKMATAFKKAWSEVTGRKYEHEAWELTEEELLNLPTIVFQLRGVPEDNDDPTAPGLAAELDSNNPTDILVAMPPTHYMEYSMEDKTFKSRVYLNEMHGGVLGANFMLGHDILFDMDNNRLGFAESDCNYLRVAAEMDQHDGGAGM